MWWIAGALAAEPSAAFFTGCWETAPDAAFPATEVWAGPTHGVMTGTLLGSFKGKATWEHFLLQPKDGVLTMTITPKGQPTVDFPLSEAKPGRLVFSNPTHDFPQRIVYEKTAEGLLVLGQAKDEAGEWSGLRLDYRRCP